LPHHIKKYKKLRKLRLKCCSLVTLVFSAVAELLTLHLSRNLSSKRR
jgi:Leucine-rich repeat (LRR) protein